MKKLSTLVIVLLLMTNLLSAQSAPKKFEVPASHIIQAEFYGETAPLKSYTPDPNAPNEVVRGLKLGYSPKHDWPLHKAVNPNALPTGPDPAWQKKYTEANSNRAVSLTQDYAGLPYAPLNPPDPVMDVGPNHVIQMTNNNSGGRFQIWDKTGNILVASTQMDNFFATATGGSTVFGLGDPIVLYDQLADRWFMAEFCSGCNDIFILVSTTADPTSTWYAYKYTAPNFPDYLKFAVWPNAYTMTSNESGPSGVYAFDRVAMLAGNPATMQRFTVPDYPTIGFQASTPVGVEGPTPPPVGNSAYFMRMADDAWSASIPNDRLEIYELDVDFVTPANSMFTGPTFLATDPFDTELCGYTSFSCMDQPSGTNNLDPLRELLMYKVQYRNFGTHESIVCNHVTDVDNTDRGGVRWYELRRTGGGPWSIYQQGTYSPDADDRWMAAININADGQIGLLYNRSGSATFPSVYCTGRNPGDPLGTMTEPETLIEAGAGSNGSIRYGDYSSLSVDPSDEKTFWGTAEYNPSSQWGTRIAAFEFDLPVVATPCSELFISEYVEGTSNNKYLEIYNPTGGDVDLSDYELRRYANGTSTATSVTLSGMLASGEVIVYRNSSATIYAGASTVLSNLTHSGDDAYELYNTMTMQTADIFGNIGCDPGTQWGATATNETQDQTLRRNAAVSGGVTTNPGGTCNSSSFPTLDTEWTELAQNDVSGLGSHTSDDCPPAPSCSITNVVITDGPNCNDAPFEDESSFSISFDVAGGSGNNYVILNPANNISYSVAVSATTDGTITSIGGASSAADPGTTAQLVVVDQGNAICKSVPINITVPYCPEIFEGDIIITEIMNNPNTIADVDGEWFEVYNTTDSDIDLDGWEISDLDGDLHVIGSSVVVPAGGFAVLGRNGDSGANGGLTYDYVYGNDIELANADDELILIAPSETEIDRVEYDDGATFPDPNGASMSLSPEFFDVVANNDGANWCEGVSPYDMNNDGTPGADNGSCFDPCIIAGYETEDVGSASTEGEYDCEEEGVVTITTTALNTFDPSDNMGFVFTELCGDGSISAQLQSVSANGYGGLVMRETTDSDSKSIALFSDRTTNTMSQIRNTTGGAKTIQQHFNGPVAYWVKLERQGNWFFAYKSADGINFSYVHAAFISMNQCIEVGMAAFSYIGNTPTTATFTDIIIDGGILPLGAPEGLGIDMDFSAYRSDNIRLFPNPANSMITLDFTNTIDRPTTMVLRNNLGQLVEQRPLQIPTVRTEWDVSNLNSGLYFIEITTEGEKMNTLRFVKE